jgi:hypothetical protein
MTNVEQLDPVISKDLEILAFEGSEEDFKDKLRGASDTIRTAYWGMMGAKFMLFEGKDGKGYLRLQRNGQIHSHDIADDFYDEGIRFEDCRPSGAGDMNLLRENDKTILTFCGRASPTYGDYRKDVLDRLLKEKLDKRLRYELR